MCRSFSLGILVTTEKVMRPRTPVPIPPAERPPGFFVRVPMPAGNLRSLSRTTVGHLGELTAPWSVRADFRARAHQQGYVEAELPCELPINNGGRLSLFASPVDRPHQRLHQRMDQK
jgi:hypothetical protein